jgi:hypothetical protein
MITLVPLCSMTLMLGKVVGVQGVGLVEVRFTRNIRFEQYPRYRTG